MMTREPTSTDALETAGEGTKHETVMPLTDVALALRLRRSWMANIARILIKLDHDRGYRWSDTTFIHRGMVIERNTHNAFDRSDIQAGKAGGIATVGYTIRPAKPKILTAARADVITSMDDLLSFDGLAHHIHTKATHKNRARG